MSWEKYKKVRFLILLCTIIGLAYSTYTENVLISLMSVGLAMATLSFFRVQVRDIIEDETTFRLTLLLSLIFCILFFFISRFLLQIEKPDLITEIVLGLSLCAFITFLGYFFMIFLIWIFFGKIIYTNKKCPNCGATLSVKRRNDSWLFCGECVTSWHINYFRKKKNLNSSLR